MHAVATLPPDLARRVRHVIHCTGWPLSRIVRAALWHYCALLGDQQPLLPGSESAEKSHHKQPWEDDEQVELFDDFDGPVSNALY